MPDLITVAATEPFMVMAKPVASRCNLSCTYCYYSNTPHEAGLDSQTRMSDRLLESFIRQYIESSDGPVVNFVWHGGEPTLAGLEFYRRAVEFQKQYLPEGKACWNNLQTNGLLLDDPWCAFLSENGFDVGISIDGTQMLHDLHRVDHSGAGTYERVAKTIRRLLSHGLKPDLLCTVTSASAKEPLAVYKALR